MESEISVRESWRRCFCTQPNWKRVFLTSTSAENCAERREVVNMSVGFPSEYDVI